MPSFNVNIALGNSEMSTPADVADALGAVAADLEAGRTEGPITDANGNGVGRFYVTDGDWPTDDDEAERERQIARDEADVGPYLGGSPMTDDDDPTSVIAEFGP